jgi:hypothetical protein
MNCWLGEAFGRFKVLLILTRMRLLFYITALYLHYLLLPSTGELKINITTFLSLHYLFAMTITRNTISRIIDRR